MQACATDKAQPGWVFRGVCKYVRKLSGGKSIGMPLYAGFAVTYHIPKNNAGATQKIIVAVANRTDIAALKGRHRLGPFPANKTAFLYFKTVNFGTAIRFRKKTQIVFSLTNDSGTALGTPCSIDRLERSGGINTWKALPIAGKISGKLLTFSVPRRNYITIPHGPAYYSFTCASAPTPSPSPSSTPTAKPSAKPTPAYCSNYSVPSTNTVQINVNDKSNLDASVIMYAWNGRSWMNNAGGFSSGAANPIPLACFPGSSGAKQKGTHFGLPPNLAAARLYIAYAPSSNTVVPDPLAKMPPGGPALTYGGPYYSVPWDVVELGTTSGAVVDLTAVTSLGLPLEMGQAKPGKSPFFVEAEDRRPATAPRAIPAPCATSGAGVIGVTSCNYDNIYTAMSSIPQYQNLVATAKFAGKIIDLRIVNPAKTQGVWNFGSDWFYNPAYLGAYPSVCSGVPTPLADGYLSCVLGAYQTKSRLYATAGAGVAGVSNSNYCVSSDGSGNFGFTKVAGASCAGIKYSSHGTLAMPIALFKYGTPPKPNLGKGCDAGFLFGMPPNTNWIAKGKGKKSGGVFATADAFAVWKGLALDLNRGAALATGSHPAGGW
ncbi:MAG TPA: hypothetical protein VKB39_05640, partial [Candidatus Baltobacteraceae bacterium]|nr:hypothetical protein [Candidatus Baltobacteraceae bacterium]